MFKICYLLLKLEFAGHVVDEDRTSFKNYKGANATDHKKVLGNMWINSRAHFADRVPLACQSGASRVVAIVIPCL